MRIRDRCHFGGNAHAQTNPRACAEPVHAPNGHGDESGSEQRLERKKEPATMPVSHTTTWENTESTQEGDNSYIHSCHVEEGTTFLTASSHDHLQTEV